MDKTQIKPKRRAGMLDGSEAFYLGIRTHGGAAGSVGRAQRERERLTNGFFLCFYASIGYYGGCISRETKRERGLEDEGGGGDKEK